MHQPNYNEATFDNSISALNRSFLERIKKYIQDTRYEQVVMIDGPWGCGKTYFVKNILRPSLECDGFKVLMISLYGVNQSSEIQRLMYESMLDYLATHDDSEEKNHDNDGGGNDQENRNERIIDKTKEKVNKVFFKLVSLVGSSIGNILTEKGVDSALFEKFQDSLLFKDTEKIVLVFDDIERCNMDIIGLMGFLNNLCENSKFRVVLVSNEKEINGEIDEVALSLQYHTVLSDVINSENEKSTNNNSAYQTRPKASEAILEAFSQKENGDEEERERDRYRVFHNRIEDIRSRLFDGDNIYNRTKEKLVGLTVRYVVNFDDAFVPLVKEYVGETKGSQTEDFVIEHKDKIISVFNRLGHSNLRTLINTLIECSAVIDSIDLSYEAGSYENEILEHDKQSLLSYAAYSWIKYVDGKKSYAWKGLRFGIVDIKFFDKEDNNGIFGFAFVDEFRDKLIPDKQTINKDLSDHIRNMAEMEGRRRADDEYKKLALFELKNWWYLEDDEVKKLISRMKSELDENKYEPQDYKGIIHLLMCINNQYFGMNYGYDQTENTDYAYEPVDPSFPIKYEERIKETERALESSKQNDSCQKELTADFNNDSRGTDAHNVSIIEKTKWKSIDIGEYIELMLKNINDNDIKVTRQMLRVLSSDFSFACEYYLFVKPILEIIDKKEEKGTVLKSDKKDSDLIWDEEFYQLCRDKKNYYMERGQFLSLYGHDSIKSKLQNATTEEIYYFRDGVETVYSFSNLGDVFQKDKDDVCCILKALVEDKDKREKYNSQSSRTKEIALRRLEADFRKYNKNLGNKEIGRIITEGKGD